MWHPPIPIPIPTAQICSENKRSERWCWNRALEPIFGIERWGFGNVWNMWHQAVLELFVWFAMDQNATFTVPFVPNLYLVSKSAQEVVAEVPDRRRTTTSQGAQTESLQGDTFKDRFGMHVFQASCARLCYKMPKSWTSQFIIIEVHSHPVASIRNVCGKKTYLLGSHPSLHLLTWLKLISPPEWDEEGPSRLESRSGSGARSFWGWNLDGKNRSPWAVWI